MESSGKAHQTERTAVIAVHGVGHHEPGGTAEAVANLLLRFCPDNFTSLQVTPMRIDVEEPMTQAHRQNRDVRLEQAPPPTKWQEIARAVSLDVRGPAMRHHSREETTAMELPHRFMSDRLAGYEPKNSGDDIYRTVRFETKEKQTNRKVHVYEMFWNALSSPGWGIFRSLLEFYQLLFDLCTVGRHALDAAQAANPENRFWKKFKWCHAITEWLLVLPVPLLNLCLLAVASNVVLLLLPFGLKWFFVGGAAGTAMAVSTLAVFKHRERVGAESWARLLPVIALVGATILGVAYCIAEWRPRMVTTFAAFLWSGAAFTLLFCLLPVMERRRPNSKQVGAAIVGASAIVFLFLLWLPDPENQTGGAALINSILMAFEVLLCAMYCVWGLLFLMVIATTFAGFAAVRAARKAAAEDGVYERFKRAAWTGNLTIIVPVLLVGLFNVALWQAVVPAAKHFIPPGPVQVWHDTVRLPTPLGFIFHHKVVTAEKAIELLQDSSTELLFRQFVVLGLGAVCLAWALLSSVWLEIKPPRREASPHSAADRKASHWLGANLTQGFLTMRLGGEIVRWSVIGLTILTMALTILHGHGATTFERKLSPYLQLGLATAVAGTILARGPFEKLKAGFQTILGVALDVINWLRLHPSDENPRARITARYMALLRHVCEWRDDDGGGYTKLIIVAHSQGTVISADVFRYLNGEARMGWGDKRLDRIFGNGKADLPVTLFTMGSPLRQIYSLRFPHLYEWVRQPDETAKEQEKPDPTELGITKWVNAYRSGDYVGRYLWHADGCADAWDVTAWNRAANRRELCLGAGAHTHYWDETARAVAEELQRLV